jgi:hypothetical protein
VRGQNFFEPAPFISTFSVLWGKNHITSRLRSGREVVKWSLSTIEEGSRVN